MSFNGVVLRKNKTINSHLMVQCYGLTEAMGVFRTWGPEESLHWGATGRVSGGFEAKIVKPDTGDALAPGKQGELWIRGPAIMKGKDRHTESKN